MRRSGHLRRSAKPRHPPGVIEEVIVTAQRRAENLQEVPISISVVGAEQIERSGMRGARDYVQRLANVTFNENDQQGTKNGDVSIRGISDLTSGGNERIIQSRPAIGMNVDEFSVSSVASGSANPPLDDIEGIEILRGPQGTYFGRNATGGAVNIVTRKPDENAMARVRVGYGSFETYSVGAVGNIPVMDDLYVRGGIAFEQSNGPVQNLSHTGNDADHEDVNARLAIRWQPENWTIDLTGQIVREDQGNLGKIPTGQRPAGFLGIGPGASGTTDPVSTCGMGEDIFFQNDNDRYNCEDQDTFQEVENSLVILRPPVRCGALHVHLHHRQPEVGLRAVRRPRQLGLGHLQPVEPLRRRVVQPGSAPEFRQRLGDWRARLQLDRGRPGVQCTGSTSTTASPPARTWSRGSSVS